MIKREISSKFLKLARQYPVVTITGPRQSGKTVLCQALFPELPYITLENIDTRQRAINDPRQFLRQTPNGAVIDEIQRAPDLLSYIQTIVDERQKPGQFILTGSRQFEMMESINQSLAGRTAILRLLPFSYTEIYGKKNTDLDNLIFTGFYPRIFDKKLDPTEALSFYTTTYLERDVRTLLNIKDLSKFELFLKLCAARTGQILNLSSLGNDCGINHNTAKNWLSVLEASFVVHLLRPHHANFNKRLLKSPKLYFIDVALAAFLLDIQSPQHVASHPLRGALFETFIVGEFLKWRFNQARPSNLYYFRDNVGNEIDLLLDYGTYIIPVEIKAGETVASNFYRGIKYYTALNPKGARLPSIVYAGNDEFEENGTGVFPFNKLSHLFSALDKIKTKP